MSHAKPTTEASFAADVLQSPIPVLVDFWAEWCGPCRMVSPILDEIATERADSLRIVKVNVDEHPGLAAQYKITSIPAMKLFKNGTELHTIIGAQPKPAILEAIDQAL